jgi:hypothetical protein
MPLQAHELARRESGALILRDQPIRVRWNFQHLTTSDAHGLSCTFATSVAAVPENIERRMLAEVLLADRDTLTADDIAAHFLPALQPAAAGIVANLPVEELLTPDTRARGTLLDALKTAAKPVAFACGLELLAPFALEFQSDSFQRQKLRSMQQTLMEQQRTGEIQHLERAAELLKKFEGIRRSAPELSAGRVLDQISPADRGVMLRTLQLANAKGAAAAMQTLWVAAGSTLVKIDVSDPSRTPELISLPGDLGPFRSVRSANIAGRMTLLIGAQRGFFAIQTPDFDQTRAYSFPGLESPLGFNAIVAQNEGRTFRGTHSDAGLATWDADNPTAPTRVVPPVQFLVSPIAAATSDSSASISSGRGPKHLCAVDDRRLLFAAGPQLFLWDGQAIAPVADESRSDVVGLFRDSEGAIIVRDDGTISRLDGSSPMEVRTIQRRPMRIRAAGTLPWMDSQRLLLAAEDGAIGCIGLEDQLASEYISPHRGLRIVAGSASLVAAVSPDRQRVILWNSWDGQRPLAEIYITARTRHRIADLCFV